MFQISKSALVNFKKCQKAEFYKRNDYEEKATDTSHFVKGNAYHFLAESTIKKRLAGIEIDKPENISIIDILNAKKDFNPYNIEEILKEGSVRGIEKSFEFNIKTSYGDIKGVGRYDLQLSNEYEEIVVDWKSGYKVKSNLDIEAMFYLYSLYINTDTELREKKLYTFFRASLESRDSVKFTVNAKDVKIWEKELIDMVEEYISVVFKKGKEAFKAEDDANCINCAFYNLCWDKKKEDKEKFDVDTIIYNINFYTLEAKRLKERLKKKLEETEDKALAGKQSVAYIAYSESLSIKEDGKRSSADKLGRKLIEQLDKDKLLEFISSFKFKITDADFERIKPFAEELGFTFDAQYKEALKMGDLKND